MQLRFLFYKFTKHYLEDTHKRINYYYIKNPFCFHSICKTCKLFYLRYLTAIEKCVKTEKVKAKRNCRKISRNAVKSTVIFFRVIFFGPSSGRPLVRGSRFYGVRKSWSGYGEAAAPVPPLDTTWCRRPVPVCGNKPSTVRPQRWVFK